jgi:uncharacterized protein
MALRKIALAGLLTMSSLIAAAQPPDTAYLQSFEKWKAELIDSRKKNWLPLAGLFWLKPGENTFGSADDNVIVLPAGPAHAGVFERQDKAVTVKLQSGVAAKIGGKIAAESKLDADVTDHPTIIELGALRMFLIERGDRLGIRVRDLNSPAINNYAGPVFFPLDLSYKVTATFVPSDGKKTVDVPNVLGDVTPSPVVGQVHFKLNGQDLTLTSFEGNQKDGLSFVISDLTSKTDTYPGGRFLDTDPVVDSKVVLDFNRAYSPPCSVTPYATCPLAPKENQLPLPLPVGEKYDRKHAHQYSSDSLPNKLIVIPNLRAEGNAGEGPYDACEAAGTWRGSTGRLQRRTQGLSRA